ncbi:spore germination protein, partial [Pseudoalteromonas sp. SIMBA_148]
LNERDALELITEDMMTVGNVSSIDTWESLFASLMAGDTIVLIGGIGKALSACTKGGETRSISESTTQVVVRGPKGGFIESI